MAALMSYPVCDDCGKDAFVEYHGDLTCTSCGLVKLSHMVDDTAGFRTFASHLDGYAAALAFPGGHIIIISSTAAAAPPPSSPAS